MIRDKKGKPLSLNNETVRDWIKTDWFDIEDEKDVFDKVISLSQELIRNGV